MCSDPARQCNPDEQPNEIPLTQEAAHAAGHVPPDPHATGPLPPGPHSPGPAPPNPVPPPGLHERSLNSQKSLVSAQSVESENEIKRMPFFEQKTVSENQLASESHPQPNLNAIVQPKIDQFSPKTPEFQVSRHEQFVLPNKTSISTDKFSSPQHVKSSNSDDSNSPLTGIDLNKVSRSNLTPSMTRTYYNAYSPPPFGTNYVEKMYDFVKKHGKAVEVLEENANPGKKMEKVHSQKRI